MTRTEQRDLRALSSGELIPRASWGGTVAAVYSHAINVVHPSGLLVGVVAAASQMSPFSVRVPGLFGDTGGVAPVETITPKARCEWGRTSFSIAEIRVDLDGAAVWSGAVKSSAVFARADWNELARHLRRALSAVGVPDGLRQAVVADTAPAIFAQRAKEVLQIAVSGRSETDCVLHGLSGLLGLGIGFTPSGDDFLAGMLLAQELAGSDDLAVDREEIYALLSRTNDGGRTLLLGSLQGRFPAYLLTFADRLREAESIVDSRRKGERVFAAVRTAVSHGETSGSDAVSGFTWYIGQLSLSGQFDGTTRRR